MKTYDQAACEELERQQDALEIKFADDYRELAELDAAVEDGWRNAIPQEEYEKLILKAEIKADEMGEAGKMVEFPAEYVHAEWDRKFGACHA